MVQEIVMHHGGLDCAGSNNPIVIIWVLSGMSYDGLALAGLGSSLV